MNAHTRARVTLIEKATGRTVAGEMRSARVEDIKLWLRWLPGMSLEAEDVHWEWDEFIALALDYPSQIVAYVLIAEKALQGLMLLELEFEDGEGNACIHGLRISTAPWNRPPNNRYRFVGSLLVAQAVELSIGMGCEGRLWLESLPGAEEFYRGLGMIGLREKSVKEGLTPFKFDSATARVFLEQMSERRGR